MKRVFCFLVGHDPLEDFEGNVRCGRCFRKLRQKNAPETFAHRLFGDDGDRELRRQRAKEPER